jgi:hypothetical protein
VFPVIRTLTCCPAVATNVTSAFCPAVVRVTPIGAARIHAARLAALARVLRVSADELLGLAPARTARGNGRAPDRRFLRRLERLHQLSRRDPQAILGTIDAFLTKVC